MSINYAVPQEYEFEFYYGATGSVLAAASALNLTTRNINPSNLLSFALKDNEVLIPESAAAVTLADGHQDQVTIDFYGAAAGGTEADPNPNDTFFELSERFATMMNAQLIAPGYHYIRAAFWNDATKVRYRRYGRWLGVTGTHQSGTMFECVSGISASFRTSDAAIYNDLIKTDSVTVTSGTGNKATTDAGRYRSRRLVISITKTGGSNPANVQVKNADNHSFTIAGSLASVNDYWLVDMFYGTVVKSVSGVVSNDIANFSGRFWGINRGSDTITVTDGGSASFTVSLVWLERMT